MSANFRLDLIGRGAVPEDEPAYQSLMSLFAYGSKIGARAPAKAKKASPSILKSRMKKPAAKKAGAKKP